MGQYVRVLLGAAFLFVLVGANRPKRQAPNINVHQIPKTSFTCNDKKIGEYYADTEAGCQVYHVCIPGMHNKLSLMSFVCPNGTIFNQATRVCSPFDRVHCSLALKFYETLHGNLNTKRTYHEDDDADYDNYVPPAPREPVPPPPPRQATPSTRQQAPPARPQPQPISRNTIAPVQPEEPARGISRFRSGANQFRGSQTRPVQTPPPPPPPPRSFVAPAALPTIRQPSLNAPAPRQPQSPLRPPIVPAFRPPLAIGRPTAPVTQAPTTAPPRPTTRAAITTSTANYNYEYEYEYDYEDEVPDQGNTRPNEQANTRTNGQSNTRTKRDASLSYADEYESQGLDMEREPQKTGFSCHDKVPGGVYADIETDCEMFHICVPLGKHKMLDYKVHCANSNAFDQETGSCRPKVEFKCEKAQLFYQVDKMSQPASGKKPVYKKSSYSKSRKAALSYKA